jgi:dTDP-4-amino-4,6-dideoxygalactose transaminase
MIKPKPNEKLAIKGGHKTLSLKEPHYVWPPITKAAEQAVLKQLRAGISIYDRSGIFEKFENAFARYHKRKFALLTSSGTAAIHSMFVAAGFQNGDEVICPAYTFFATVTPLLFTGAKPVLCDCDENGNIDPNEIEKKITPKTKGVVITHMWGIPCQMDRIVEICKKNKLLLLEDCSHAHGAYYKNQIVGSFGDIAAWSLQGPKNVSGGEGGILATNNEEFYYRALLLGHYNKRCKQEIPRTHPLYRYSTTGMGLKYRAHPLAVALAFETFKKLNVYLAMRDKFARRIINAVKNIPGLAPPQITDKIQPSWYALIFQYQSEKFQGLSIKKFFEALQAEGLLEADRPGSTLPLNLLPLFQTPNKLFPVYKSDSFSYSKGDFPRAEKFYQNAIKFPVWAMQKDASIVASYIRGIKKVSNNYQQLL